MCLKGFECQTNPSLILEWLSDSVAVFLGRQLEATPLVAGRTATSSADAPSRFMPAQGPFVQLSPFCLIGKGKETTSDQR